MVVVLTLGLAASGWRQRRWPRITSSFDGRLTASAGLQQLFAAGQRPRLAVGAAWAE